MITWAKAYRLRETFTGVVLLCPLIVWFGGRTMQLSALTPIATTWFLSLGLIVVSALPLSDSFALLEATFARSRLLRTIRAAVVAICVGAGAACLVATTTAPGIVAWLFLLAAVTVLATIALGPRALFLTLAVGAGSIIVEHWVINAPVSTAATAIGTPLAAALFASSLVLFAMTRGLRTTSPAGQADQ